MPIIEVAVPDDPEHRSETGKELRRLVRQQIKRVVVNKGWAGRHLDVTVEFHWCVDPERLLVRYWTRNPPKGDYQLDSEAYEVGRIVEERFKSHVECRAEHHNYPKVGLYITE